MALPNDVEQLEDNLCCFPFRYRTLFLQNAGEGLALTELAYDIKSMLIVIEFINF